MGVRACMCDSVLSGDLELSVPHKYMHALGATPGAGCAKASMRVPAAAF